MTIIGAIICGVLLLNEYYDNKGACGWSLFHGGYYKHKERHDEVIAGLIKEIITRDKYARKTLMQQQGKSEADINQTLKNLEPQYQKEKEKMQKYCYLDFDKKPYFQKKSMEAKPSDYCVIGTGNNVRDEGYGGFDLKYNFDKESLKFFNEVHYITKLMRPSMGINEKPNTWYPYIFYGIKFEGGFSPCETRYHGGENTGWLQDYKTKIHIYDKTKQVIAY